MNRKNSKTKYSLSKIDVFLMMSITLVISGLLAALLFYNLYISGRPEGLIESRSGTRYVSAIEAGDSDYKDTAILGLKIAGVGLVSSGIFWSIKYSSK